MEDFFTALWKLDCAAEIVDGHLRHLSERCEEEALTAGEILISLRKHAKENGAGRASPSSAVFCVDLPNRKSFSSDAGFINRTRSGSMGAIDGAPAFAVEVRGKNEYDPVAEAAIARKRMDYFAAGTQVVWDVDLLSNDVVRKYALNAPDEPIIFRRGEVADAELAVPGWRMDVDGAFQ